MSVPHPVTERARVHQVYKTALGQRVPSVTTILGILAKPALIRWAHGLGLKGIDMDTYVDELAGVGTLAHQMILDHLRGDKTDTSAYAPAQTDLAENCFLKYLEWERQHKVVPTMVETPLVSETHKFGGKPDFIGRIDGAMTLMDFKTGKGIYDDHWFQLGGYALLVGEHARCGCGEDIWPLQDYRILNIGRSEDERFVEEQRLDIAVEEDIFLHALMIYKLKKGKA